jgi:hypothetical protein
MKLLFLILLFSANAHALDAVVTVLETPMLKSRSYNAKVVQYLRKGDVVKIHPSIKQEHKYDQLAPSIEKQNQIREKLKQSSQWESDPLFINEEVVTEDEEFIPALDRQGHVVYLIRDHLYIYFENERELAQKILYPDPTDYRLTEPLPSNYPLFTPYGYRGIFTLGFTQPYSANYNYNSDIKSKGYSMPIDVNLAFLRKTPDDTQDRFYIGGNINFRTFANNFSLTDGRNTFEKYTKIGVGPYITYDAFKGLEDRISLYGVINVYLLNFASITQEDNEGNFDKRDYRGYSITPRLGVQYHRKKIFTDLDFIIGSAIEVESPTTYTTSDSSEQNWWDGKSFKTGILFNLNAYLGVQSAY